MLINNQVNQVNELEGIVATEYQNNIIVLAISYLFKIKIKKLMKYTTLL